MRGIKQSDEGGSTEDRVGGDGWKRGVGVWRAAGGGSWGGLERAIARSLCGLGRRQVVLESWRDRW